MKEEAGQLVSQLFAVANKFNDENNALKHQLLHQLQNTKLKNRKYLLTYHQVLLFMCAHPASPHLFTLAQQELLRVAAFFKRLKQNEKMKFLNTGYPFTTTLSTFSHDLLQKMFNDKSYTLTFDSFSNSELSLNDTLQFTLPLIEKEITTVDFSNRELLNTLLQDKNQTLPFLVGEFSKLNHIPFIKDHLFDKLGIYVKLKPIDHGFSKAFNKITPSQFYYHTNLLKNFDHVQLLNKKLPAPASLTPIEKTELITCMQNALVLLQRETDPVTYIDERSLRYYELERGIGIAIYGMQPNRQLPVESYIGYTLFKNGYPAAYGGSWVLGKRALFGINIFEAFRGGESGFVLCQLLRVYKQVFNLSYFEVEPYQYGKDNPEGIQSGAFWFYYKYGFRPIDNTLNALAGKEQKKINSKKGYRTPESILLQFTESNIAWNMGSKTPISMADIRERVQEIIAKKYNGIRVAAEQAVISSLKKKCGKLKPLNKEQQIALSELAFLCEALNIQKGTKLNALKKMVYLKASDVYAYQQYLQEVLR